jgi:hypothetical protein
MDAQHNMAGADQSQQWGRLGSEWLGLAQRTADPKGRASLLAVSHRCLELAELAQSSRRCAIEAGIGRGLRDFYSLPSDVPHRLLALLAQMNAENAKQDRERGRG